MSKGLEFWSNLEFSPPVDVKRPFAAEVNLEEVEEVEEDAAVERVVNNRRVAHGQVVVAMSANSLVRRDALDEHEVELRDEKQCHPDQMEASVEELPSDESRASEGFEN